MLKSRYLLLNSWYPNGKGSGKCSGQTIEGLREEQLCYKLVKDSLLYHDRLLIQVIDVITKDSANHPKRPKFFNKKMKEMFKAMRKSLREELGSVKKDFLTV